MKTRREAKQLSTGDQFQVTLLMQLEVVGAVSPTGDAVTLNVKVVDCGPNCGRGCDCHASMLVQHEGPWPLTLPAGQRLKYLGNLPQLLADSQRIQSQISRLQGASAGREPNRSASRGTESANR